MVKSVRKSKDPQDPIHRNLTPPRLKCNRRKNVVLIQWVAAHQDHRYPTDYEKNVLARLSGKNLKQLGYWFANNRREMKKNGIKEWLRKHPVPNVSTNHYLSLLNNSTGELNM